MDPTLVGRRKKFDFPSVYRFLLRVGRRKMLLFSLFTVTTIVLTAFITARITNDVWEIKKYPEYAEKHFRKGFSYGVAAGGAWFVFCCCLKIFVWYLVRFSSLEREEKLNFCWFVFPIPRKTVQ